MIKLNIRRAVPADAVALSELICQTAEKILKPHYTEHQWDIFIRYYSEEILKDKIETQVVFCGEIDGSVVGTIALDGDFVVGFYTRLNYISQGIGRQLMQCLENYAVTAGIHTIQLAASPEGLGFYYKNGWQKVREFTIEHFGVGFDETLMVKKIG